MRDGLAAGAAGALLSGIPSSLLTLARGDDLLASTRAVGRALFPTNDDDFVLLPAGVVGHVAISLGWGVVLEAVLPRRRTVLAGALAGLAIAALDLRVVGRRLPAIRRLPLRRQVLDHVAYGAVVGAVLIRRPRLSRRRAAWPAGGRRGAGSRS